MLLNDIINRIKTTVPEFQYVGSPIADYIQKTPAAFVYLISQTAKEFVIDNKITVEIVAKFNEFNDLKIAVRDSLINYRPSYAISPLSFVSGSLTKIDGDRLVWAEHYTCLSCN